MGSFAGNTLIDTLARRLRDTANIGYTRVFVLDIINRTQRSINARLGLVMSSATFATTNSPLHVVSAIAGDIVRIVDIRDNDRVLTKIPLDHLVFQDSRWFRSDGPQAEVWAPLGRTHIAVIPVARSPRTLTAVYVQQTTNLADAGAPLSAIPDEYKDIWLDLAEAVLLFRSREFTEMKKCLERVLPALGLEDTMQDMRRIGDKGHA